MARQIIPIDKVVKCHVNSNDSSPTYESGTAYAAGTLVYNQDYAASNFTDGYKLGFRYHIYKAIELS